MMKTMTSPRGDSSVYGDDVSVRGKAALSVGRQLSSRKNLPSSKNGAAKSGIGSESESESYHSSMSSAGDHRKKAAAATGAPKNNFKNGKAKELVKMAAAAVEKASRRIADDTDEEEEELSNAVESSKNEESDVDDDDDDDDDNDDSDDSETEDEESISSTAVQDGKHAPVPTSKLVRNKTKATLPSKNQRAKPVAPPPQEKFHMALEDDNNSLLDTITEPAVAALEGVPGMEATETSRSHTTEDETKQNGTRSYNKKQTRELGSLHIHSMLPGESLEQYAKRKKQGGGSPEKDGRRGRKKTEKGEALTKAPAQEPEPKKESDFVDRVIPVGTRVYCEYPLDKYWYWGTVTNRYKPKFSRFFLYDVKYDDGDTATKLGVAKMVTKEEFDDSSEPQQEKKQKRAYNKKPKVAEQPEEIAKEATKQKDVKEKGANQKAIKPYTPHELWQKRCKTCANCLKPDCTKCVCCLGNGNNPDPDAKNCCLQKMCHLIELPRKAQKAPAGFPKGWRFAFDDTITKKAFGATTANKEGMGGLILLPPPPNARTYYMVEKAKNHSKLKLADVDTGEFYRYVGLSRPQQQLGGDRPAKKRSQDTEEAIEPQVVKKSRKDLAHEATVDSQVDMMRELFVRRCKNCSMCIKPTCKNCSACKRNSTASGQRIVCYQKMCCQISVEEKAQDALGLPDGWKFFYTDPKYLAWHTPVDNTGLAGLVVQSPTGARYSTVDAAAAFLGSSDNVKNMAAIFYDHVGCIIQPRNPLQGKGFRQKWVDVEGKIQVIYGRIAHVKTIDRAGKHYTVEFDPESRALVNSSNPPNGVIAPERQNISESFAFGGCLDFDPKVVPTSTSPFYTTWNVPDFIHETYDTDDFGFFAPRLTIHYRGFQLIVQAKQSTIPNAGKGVFITCTSLLGRGRNLNLKAGELLDLGVYAPFQPQDTKKNHTFNLKNFLFASICGEWTFDTTFDGDAYLFDITDNQTGELHDLAKRHIPAYVNETDGVRTPSITAQHDAAGSVHYLLGHLEEHYGTLSIAADGIPREVFIDYGDNYEDFRIRKNYSRLPRSQSEPRLRELLENDHLEELDQLSSLNMVEVTDCIDFLEKDWYNPNRQYPVSVVTRALLALMVLKQKLNDFIDALPPDEMHIGPHHNTDLGPRAKLEVPSKKAQRLIQCLYKYWNCCYRLKDTLVGDKVYTTSLEKILKRTTIDDMSPEELETAIMGI